MSCLEPHFPILPTRKSAEFYSNPMTRIIYAGTLPKVVEATRMANEVLADLRFHAALAEREAFDYSNASGKIISDLIKQSTLVAEVIIYRSSALPPFRNVFGYIRADKATTIFINERHFWRSVEAIASTIIHEFIHLIDLESTAYHFDHGNNKPKGKDFTAPYLIDTIAYNLLTGKGVDADYHDPSEFSEEFHKDDELI